MSWHKAPVDGERVREVAARYGLDTLTASIVVRRGFDDPADLLALREGTVHDLAAPFLLEGMEDVIERLRQAVADEERVLIFGDRDVDGVTAVALMHEALEEMGLHPEFRVPMGDDAYGLSIAAVEQFAESGGTLLVTVDCGTSSTAEVARATELGVDVLVFDHHNPQDEIPPALAIINPKIPESRYPFPGLCAAAVVNAFRTAVALSETEIYQQPLCLLNLRPGSDTVVVEVIRMRNLVETDRLVEELPVGAAGIDQTRTYAFLLGRQILLYEADVQRRLFADLFGPSVDLEALDLRDRIAEVFPDVAGKSLPRLLRESKRARYVEGYGEIDVLRNLFVSFVMRSASIGEGLRRRLDLVALATVADMMPIRSENRILVKHGLPAIATTRRPGLRALLERAGLDAKEAIGGRDISWKLGPLLNAAGRMGHPDVAVRLLIETDRAKATELAEEVYRLNEQRKQVGEGAWKLAEPDARTWLKSVENIIVVRRTDLHRGVIGIVAGRLARAFRVPAVVLTRATSGYIGSVRGARGFHVTSYLSQFGDLFSDWGGHDAAGGFSIDEAHTDDLLARIAEGADQIALDDSDAKIEIDAELPHRYVTPALLDVVDTLAPFGQENPPPIFMVRGMVIRDVRLMGREAKNHVRLRLGCEGSEWPAVYWNAAELFVSNFQKDDRVDVVCHVDRDTYSRPEGVRMTVLDMRHEDHEG